VNEFSEAAKIAKETEYFKNKTVFIDGFTGFTAGEMLLIETMIKSADNVYIALTYDRINSENDINFDLFSPAVKTIAYIKTISENAEIAFDEEHLTTAVRFNKKDLAAFSENCLRVQNMQFNGESESVKAFEAADIYEETDFVAAMLHKLCIEDGKYQFKDFVIAVHDTNTYASIISGAFERYQIPVFLDEKIPVSNQTIIIFLMSFLRIACLKNPDTDDYIRLLKTGFLRYKTENNEYLQIKNDDIYAFDDFCYINDVRGFHFEKPFDDERFERIRISIRDKAELFRNKCKNADGKTICEHLAEIIADFEIPERLSSLKIFDNSSINMSQNPHKNLQNKTDESLFGQRFLTGAWNLFCKIIEDFHECLSREEQISLNEFYELTESIISESFIASPPQTIDSVSVAPIGTARLNNPKCVIIMGANEDVIPAAPMRNSLISDTDLVLLRGKNIRISGETNEKIAEERFAVYTVCSGASDLLCFTYPRFDLGGNKLIPSELIKNATDIFTNKVFYKTSDFKPEIFCRTPESAYNKYIETQNANRQSAENIKTALEELEDFKEKFRKRDFHQNINPETAKHLYGQTLRLSATSFEEYRKCPFMFFTARGLRLSKRKKIEFDALIRGNVVHDALNRLIKEIDSFDTTETEKIYTAIDTYMKEYLEKLPGGKRFKSPLFLAEYLKLKGAVCAVAKHILSEMKQSRFKPSDTEFSFGFLDKNTPEPPYTIPINSDVKVEFSGMVDRVDIYENHIRITDYKTGKKDWDYRMMAEGLELQPLLYIFALTDSKATKYRDFTPAGTLFLFAYDPVPDEKDRYLEESFDDYRRPIGAVIDDIEIIDAMEEIPEKCAGKYIPVTMKSCSNTGEKQLSLRGTSVLSSDEFEAFKEHILRTVQSTANAVYDGISVPLPIAKRSSEKPDNSDIKNEFVPCTYCDYASVCGNFPPLKNYRTFQTEDKKTAKQKIISGEINYDYF
jgi:ATP-dependent helicase/nuclease subunit B